MLDLSCFLAGAVRLLGPVLLLLILCKKAGARIYPALIAFAVAMPAFIIAAMIRSGFSQEDLTVFALKRGLLYGIMEEGAKYIAIRFLLENYDSRKDAVTYGIGHGALEEFSAGMACFGLIGTGRAAPDMLFFNIWAIAEGTVFAVGLTVLIFYGIRTGKSKIMLPAAMLLHALGNAFNGIFFFSKAIVFAGSLLITGGICFAAYRCWKELYDPYEDESF
ncbi:MAG: YhfC family intramembrane metalloprotease [Oscillospiraceae bacterium]|nr:YhfC family intramembrane metalloprotease [Oscillospiraceae bacterium]